MNPTQDKVEALEISLPLVPAKDKGFANSLIESYKKSKRLSPKQEYWVGELLDRALGKAVKKEVKTVEVGSFSGVYALFQKAKEHLKYPKIHLQLENGLPVQVSMAGQKSKYPGQINVTDGGHFGMNKWYGRVDSKGAWVQGKGYEELDKVESLLKKLAENPAKTAKEQALLTGNCCFCGLKLFDEHSTAAGFGPVCAKNYGLSAQWKNAVGVFEKGVA